MRLNKLFVRIETLQLRIPMRGYEYFLDGQNRLHGWLRIPMRGYEIEECSLDPLYCLSYESP